MAGGDGGEGAVRGDDRFARQGTDRGDDRFARTGVVVDAGPPLGRAALAGPRLAAPPGTLASVDALVTAALALGAEAVGGWSAAERALVRGATSRAAGLPGRRRPARPSSSPPDRRLVKELRERIAAGEDPLGDAFSVLRPPAQRRTLGQTYTPPAIVSAMVEWAAAQRRPARVVDPGAGSGRFTVAAGRRFPAARLVAIDVDPLATVLTRANVAAAGLARRTTVVCGDYRSLAARAGDPAANGGPTLFLGNPPYVRHHDLAPGEKGWLARTAGRRGLVASGLSGLHVHFFLATAELAAPGDLGTFITAAEWLDVNYGRLVRDLLLDGLGATGIHLLDPSALPFAGAATTGVITTFEPGRRPGAVRMRRVRSVAALGTLEGGRRVARHRLAEASRWTQLVRRTPPLPAGWIQLGDLCRVHRGAVTGANAVWVTHPGGTDLPERFLYPAVTRARELFAAGDRLGGDAHLRQVIDLPADLDAVPAATRRAVERFLRRAHRDGVADGYVARNRRAWWAVGLRPAAPILATYMARRPPAFVRNVVGARHINIAHGIYPRDPMSPEALDALAATLRACVHVAHGRTYAGGLTKFEPREMERLPIPEPAAQPAP